MDIKRYYDTIKQILEARHNVEITYRLVLKEDKKKVG